MSTVVFRRLLPYFANKKVAFSWLVSVNAKYKSITGVQPECKVAGECYMLF